jgi:hypothetical protein
MSTTLESFRVTSLQVTVVQDPSSTVAAFAKFKPTPKEIVSGLAPHVFEEHGMKLKRARSSPKPPPNPLRSIAARGLGTKASPLRVSAISCEVDGETSRMYLFDQPDHHAPIVTDQVLFVVPPPVPSKVEETPKKFELSEKVEKAPLRSVFSKLQALRGFAVKLR